MLVGLVVGANFGVSLQAQWSRAFHVAYRLGLYDLEDVVAG